MAKQDTGTRTSPSNCCFLTRFYARELCVFGKGGMQESRTHSKKQDFLFWLCEKHLVGTVFSISRKMPEADS